MDTNNAKFCKDCKHATPFKLRFLFWTKENWSLAKCSAPRGKVIDLTSGGEKMEFAYCSAQRGCKADFVCGEEGRWYEPRTL